jgi:peptidoglycan/xylan/chitin deacetylase (PgdA/CDA1 family)
VNRHGKGYRRLLSSPVLSASAAVHLGAAAAVLTYPRDWPWAVGAVAANHGVLAAAGLWPRSRLLGPNWIRLPDASGARGEVALTIDDGPDPAVTPQVLDLLAKHGVQATFFCVGERVERGHAIENHSHRHRHNFSLLGPRGMRDEIVRAQDSIARITGSTPRFFRAPAGLRNPFLDPVLESLALRLASWTRRGFDTINGNADVVYRRLVRSLGGGDILLLHDGNAALGAAGRPVILDVLPRLLERLRAVRLSPVTLRAALQ